MGTTKRDAELDATDEGPASREAERPAWEASVEAVEEFLTTRAHKSSKRASFAFVRHFLPLHALPLSGV